MPLRDLKMHVQALTDQKVGSSGWRNSGIACSGQFSPVGKRKGGTIIPTVPSLFPTGTSLLSTDTVPSLLKTGTSLPTSTSLVRLD